MKTKLDSMKYILLLGLYLISNTTFSKENCSDESIGLKDSSSLAEKLFYKGTCHYRNQEYRLSAKYWGDLSDLEDVEDGYEVLQIDSLNNLGYLKFYGLGIPEDKTGAVFYWKKAISLGHDESEFHLCHAYADKDEPTFNVALGKKHCEKAFLIYSEMEQPDEEIMRSIEKYRSSL